MAIISRLYERTHPELPVGRAFFLVVVHVGEAVDLDPLVGNLLQDLPAAGWGGRRGGGRRGGGGGEGGEGRGGEGRGGEGRNASCMYKHHVDLYTHCTHCKYNLISIEKVCYVQS